MSDLRFLDESQADLELHKVKASVYFLWREGGDYPPGSIGAEYDRLFADLQAAIDAAREELAA